MGEKADIGLNVDGEAVDRELETRQGVRRWLRREVFGVLFVAAILFISAGRLDWMGGWGLVAIYAVWVAANALILIPRSPELLAERAKRQKGVKSWDTVLLGIIGLSTMAKYILAGLDIRFGWTTQMPLSLQVAAFAIAGLGYALGTWAMAANVFFSTIVRIQEDRGHAVATGGPYQYVRHPGYTGVVVFELVTPILLGSMWALIPGGLNALLTIVRTALEDRTLHEELDGYRNYAGRVRYRLLPGVW